MMVNLPWWSMKPRSGPVLRWKQPTITPEASMPSATVVALATAILVYVPGSIGGVATICATAVGTATNTPIAAAGGSDQPAKILTTFASAGALRMYPASVWIEHSSQDKRADEFLAASNSGPVGHNLDLDQHLRL